MPKIISRQPAWLSRHTPAQQLFSVKSSDSTEEYQRNGEKLDSPSLKILAHRDSEVFVADGNTIRWADLASMKDNWESTEDNGDIPDGAQFRVLELRYVAEPIRQLIMSPSKTLLAVVTSHTVHICTIPDSKLLSEPDDAMIRPKMQMLGPTTHVVSAARIVSTLWHPLGVGGTCLVTVSSDAVVRVWELSMQNRYTFEEPTTALDLRKLKQAKSSKADVRPRPLGISEGFSYDYLGMDAAGASFGGIGAADEVGWSAMTLWIAMAEGDVYALCPLLPKKWQANPAVLSNIALTVLVKKDGQSTETETADFTTQWQWLIEQEKEPVADVPPQHAFEQPDRVYTQAKGAVSLPKLQGPFSIVPGDLEYELALVDIHVIAPTAHASNPNNQEGMDDLLGMPASLVCLLSQTATVYVCLELEGIHGSWLPKEPESNTSGETTCPELIVLGALETLKQQEESSGTWPSITADIHSRHDFYVAHHKGIWRVSAAAWVQSLEAEMSSETTAGAALRMAVEAEGIKLERQPIISLSDGSENRPSAPLVMDDSDLGYIVLTVHNSSPYIAVLEKSPVVDEWMAESQLQIKNEPSLEPNLEGVPDLTPRAPYVPSHLFRPDIGALKDQLRKPTGLNAKTSQIVLSEQIRLSPAVLDFMTHDHRVLSDETNKLGHAIADLFTHCRVIQSEFVTEIQHIREVAERVESINGNYSNDSTRSNKRDDGSQKLESRLNAAKDRQATLLRRFEALREKTSTISRPLSDREKTWIGEVDRIAKNFPENLDDDDQSLEQSTSSESDKRANKRVPKNHLQRYHEARDLASGLCGDAQKITEDSAGEQDDASTQLSESTASFSPLKSLRVPADIRRQKMALIDGLLERESALVDAMTERLERLKVQI